MVITRASEALSKRIRIILKTQPFFYGMAFRPNANNENGHQKRNFSKTLFKVELFENAVFLFSCERGGSCAFKRKRIRVDKAWTVLSVPNQTTYFAIFLHTFTTIRFNLPFLDLKVHRTRKMNFVFFERTLKMIKDGANLISISIFVFELFVFSYYANK